MSVGHSWLNTIFTINSCSFSAPFSTAVTVGLIEPQVVGYLVSEVRVASAQP